MLMGAGTRAAQTQFKSASPGRKHFVADYGAWLTVARAPAVAVPILHCSSLAAQLAGHPWLPVVGTELLWLCSHYRRNPS